MTPQEVLQAQREFLTGIALYGNKPDQSNSNLQAVAKAYQELGNEAPLVSDCTTCGDYASMKSIYQYCEDNAWFEAE